jgi:hypothetical protein
MPTRKDQRPPVLRYFNAEATGAVKR